MIQDIHKEIFDSMPNAAMILDADMVFVDANPAYCQAVQRRKTDMIGRYVFDVFPDIPERVDLIRKYFERTLAGETLKLDAQPYKLKTPDGREEDRIWQIAQFPVRCEKGIVRFLVQRAEDITEREELRVQRDLVTAELNHRVRNTLAVVQSLADQTGLHSQDIETFLRSFQGRLAAMSRNFAALTDSHWTGLDFENILRTELEPYAGPSMDRIRFEGPKLKLTVRASKFTSMLSHELVTNASKHGYLTQTSGRLDLRWWIEGDELHADWLESGLDGIVAPERTGFGFELFGMMGNMKITPQFATDGIKVRIRVPLKLSVTSGEFDLADT